LARSLRSRLRLQLGSSFRRPAERAQATRSKTCP
jgi:hypothetical protein